MKISRDEMVKVLIYPALLVDRNAFIGFHPIWLGSEFPTPAVMCQLFLIYWNRLHVAPF